MTVNTYDIGDLVRVSAAFVDGNEDAKDPTAVVFSYRIGGDDAVSYTYNTDEEVVKDSVGNYHVDVTVSESGRYYVRWAGTGDVIAADEDMFLVRPSHFE